jgi:hypothetical protein
VTLNRAARGPDPARSVGPLSYLYVTKGRHTFSYRIGAKSLTPAWGRRCRLDWGGGGTEGGSR